MAALLRILLVALADLPALLIAIGRWTGIQAQMYLYRLRGLTILTILLAYCLIFIGAMAGGIDLLLKKVLILTAIGFILGMGLTLAVRFIPLVAVLTAILEVSRRGVTHAAVDTAENVAKGYVKTFAGILASLIFIAMVVYFTPMHNKTESIPAAFIFGLVLLFCFWWRGGIGWWQTVVYVGSIIGVIAMMVSFFLPKQAAKVEGFNPDDAIDSVITKLGQVKVGGDGEEKTAVPSGKTERLEPVLMPDGTLYLPPSAEFMLGAGTEQKFRFESLGLVAITGNHTILCDPRCTDRNGKVVSELPVRTEEWKRKYGDKPCLTDKETFYVKIRGDETTTLRARTPNDPPCKA